MSQFLEAFNILAFLNMMSRHPLLRELFLFLAFLGLTIVMTWPWARHLRNAASDPGDPYLNSWILWWDYHQTFHDPLNLFQANIFYPYRYSLAFSENNYGIALLFFPLFALGFRPLTVCGVATLMGFAFSGYGAFRLARTLTGSNGVAWVAGIAFAFVPYRFDQLPHVNYLFAGWIPLLLESLVLFAREPRRKRAAWFGAAFFVNALTCIHWFVLTLIPLGLSAAFLRVRSESVWNRAFWLRGGAALGAATLALLPFLLPYQRAAELYGFVRSAEEAARYSARPISWLTVTLRNKLWTGLGSSVAPYQQELALFPGLLPLFLAAAAFFLIGPEKKSSHAPSSTSYREPPRVLLVFLDALALICIVIALLVAGYGTIHLRFFGHQILQASSATRALALLTLAFFTRCCLAYPRALRPVENKNFIATLRSGRRSEAFGLGIIWTVIGFAGSFGMNLFFHRALFDFFRLFRSIRVPARWAMICYLGLAILAGLGARRLAELIAGWRPQVPKTVVYAVIISCLLFEQRSAPLDLIQGQADPDPVTLRLKETPMRGGIVELPAGEEMTNYLYVLRAADHGRPLVTAVSGFVTPIEQEIESLTRQQPVPDRFLDLLERIPASYLVIHNSLLRPEARSALDLFLARGLAAGRLRFIQSYGGKQSDDLYAVTKTEPEARSEAPIPIALRPVELSSLLREDPTKLLDDFQNRSFFIYRFYKASTGRMPRINEFMADAQRIGRGVILNAAGAEEQLENNKRAFGDEWVNRPAFKSLYNGMSNEQYVDTLFINASVSPDEATRLALVGGLYTGTETRATALRKVVENRDFAEKDFNPALVLIHYFAYLKRNPDDPPDRNMNGYNFWLKEINRTGNYQSLTRAFIASDEAKPAAAQQ